MESMNFQDILDDFELADRVLYSEHIAPHTIASLAEDKGDDWVYWDLYDFVFK